MSQIQTDFAKAKAGLRLIKSEIAFVEKAVEQGTNKDGLGEANDAFLPAMKDFIADAEAVC